MAKKPRENTGQVPGENQAPAPAAKGAGQGAADLKGGVGQSNLAPETEGDSSGRFVRKDSAPGVLVVAGAIFNPGATATFPQSTLNNKLQARKIARAVEMGLIEAVE